MVFTHKQKKFLSGFLMLLVAASLFVLLIEFRWINKAPGDDSRYIYLVTIQNQADFKKHFAQALDNTQVLIASVNYSTITITSILKP